MKFAILADIHGNASALSAVLADMEHLGVTEAVNLGDHFSGPLDAATTAELLIERGFATIRGNHDRWLLEGNPDEMGPSDRVAFEQLDQAHFTWLRSLPATMVWKDEVFVCHGTPHSDTTYWLERVEPDGKVRSATLGEIEACAEGIEATLMLCGHTHIPRLVRLRDGRVVVNPGSVGCPAYDDDVPVYHLMQTGTPNASYAIAEKVGAAWSVTFRSVPYDPHPMVERARAYGRDEWARSLATGWIA